MGTLSDDRGQRTLGEYLLGVRRGDPCPCCGAKLQDSARPSRYPPEKRGLVCLHCGCELTQVSLPFEEGVGRCVDAAA